MKILAEINEENIPTSESKDFEIRHTARAVIFDDEGKIALMHVTKEGFYKLPGGGIEDGEEPINALHRECREEAGVSITDIIPLGSIKEIKSTLKQIQISYCYRASIVGEKKLPQFTITEQDREFAVVWVAPEEAIRLVKNNQSKTLVGHQIGERELIILDAARKTSEIQQN